MIPLCVWHRAKSGAGCAVGLAMFLNAGVCPGWLRQWKAARAGPMAVDGSVTSGQLSQPGGLGYSSRKTMRPPTIVATARPVNSQPSNGELRDLERESAPR